MGKTRETGYLRNILAYDANGLTGYVPNARTLTINGTTQDLSTNRTFNIATSATLGGLTDATISSLVDNQLLRYNAATSKWVNWTPNYLTGNQSITVSGDASGSGSTTITLTLANSGVTAGTYRSVTVDAKGRVTAGTNPTTISGYGITDFWSQTLGGLYTLGANSAISGTDTLEQMLEKLQGQMNARVPASRTITINGTAFDLSADRSWTIAAGVTSFNTRTGAITLSSSDVTTALGYTPYNSTNPNGYISSYTETSNLANVTARGASTATPVVFSGNMSAWNATTPGTGLGTIQIGAANGTSNTGGAITFAARDGGGGANAQAGIYITSDGSYGTRMYFATTDAYVTGSKTAMSINESGIVTITRNYLQSNTDLRAPIFYDSNDTGYYADFNSTSDSSIRVRGGMLMGPNPTWGAYLQIGGNGRNVSYASVVATSGNLHMDCAAGYNMYLNYYSNGNIFLNGSTYYISSNGSNYNGNAATATNVYNINYALGNSHYWTGLQYFQTNNGGYAVNNSNSAALEAYSTGNNSAFMSFHKGGYYAINMGLDADNVFRIGGWSAGGNRLQMDMSGNLTMAGDVTAYSDARVKTDVKTVEHALEKVLSLRGVTYKRTDSDDTRQKLGVIAQEVLPIVPEVVNEDNFGMYNVSYGNLAGLFIEAFKEQQREIEELKQTINAFTK